MAAARDVEHFGDRCRRHLWRCDMCACRSLGRPMCRGAHPKDRGPWAPEEPGRCRLAELPGGRGARRCTAPPSARSASCGRVRADRATP